MIRSTNKRIGLLATFFVSSLFLFLITNIVNAQTPSETNETPKNDQTETVKDPIKTKRDERDIKTIVDRTQKIKDDYIIQIKLKFANSADKLSSISTKIETRIVKLEIAGEDVTILKQKLDSANKDIKDARNIFKNLPVKQSSINYTDAKKYAQSLIDARTDLESAKDTLTEIISGLKDFIIDKDDEKN